MDLIHYSKALPGVNSTVSTEKPAGFPLYFLPTRRIPRPPHLVLGQLTRLVFRYRYMSAVPWLAYSQQP